MAIDFIGDIHGHADELVELLQAMGYKKADGVYRHPHRQPFFLGDFIDRGPKQMQVLEIVRPMIESGYAGVVMGNHEHNAISYATPSGDAGEYVRPHNEKNNRQSEVFLEAFPFGSQEHAEAIAFFKKLPVFADLGKIGVVHACWSPELFKGARAFLNSDNTLTEDSYKAALQQEGEGACDLVENAVKGMHQDLPSGVQIIDKEGNQRDETRIKWWVGDEAPTSEKLFLPGVDLTEGLRKKLDAETVLVGLANPDKPIIIGHYWMEGEPSLLSQRVACVDYSVAKGGKLVSYRWDGEANLTDDRFFYV